MFGINRWLLFAMLATVASGEEVKLVKDQSFVDQAPPKTIALAYYRCNLMQRAPMLNKKTGLYEGVLIFGGDSTPRTFIECNLINVRVPIGSVVDERSNTHIVQYDVIAGSDTSKTSIGDITQELRGMRVLGRYTSPDVIHRQDTLVVDNTESTISLLLDERSQLLARLAEIDKILKPLVKVGTKPVEVVK